MKSTIQKLVGAASFGSLLLLNASVAFAQQINIRPEIAPPVDIGGLIKAVINLLFVVAAVIAIIFLIWGGIRWIISGGDKTAVESARNTIIAAIIGLVIVFLSFFILTAVFQFLGIPFQEGFKLPSATSPGIK